MSKRFWRARIGATIVALLCGVFFAVRLPAQTPDPIKCWWKTDKAAVTVAEQFHLTLTCAVNEAHGAKVVPKMEPLDPGAVQLAPFEVVSGTRHEDIQAPPWRYFQYEYTLRLVDDDAFGGDMDIPGLTITYNIQSDVAGASAGRDQMYFLPNLPMRIMSLVPKNANDIRDSLQESFAAPQARLFRASAEFIAAGVLFAFSLLTIAFAVVRIVRRNRERAPVRAPALSETALTRACLREIGRLQSEAMRSGWTHERTGLALTILRIGSAVGMGRSVSQSPVDVTVSAREGQLIVRKGILGRERIAVSASITPEIIERYRFNGAKRELDRAKQQKMLDNLAKSLITFSAVRYGRDSASDNAALNRALESGRIALKRLFVTTLWPVRAADHLFQSANMLRTSIWTR